MDGVCHILNIAVLKIILHLSTHKMCVCVCMCVVVCMYVYLCEHIHTWLCRLEVSIRCLP